MSQPRLIYSAIAVVATAVVIGATVAIMGSGNPDGAVPASPQKLETTTPSSPTIPARAAQVLPRTGDIATTAAAFAISPPITAATSGLLTIEPALPRPHEPHPARRDGYGEWVYAWPSPWETEWSDSYRFQAPLPRPIPIRGWTHDTHRFSPIVVGDRPFILISGQAVTHLNDNDSLAILTLVRRHQLSLQHFAEAFATADTSPLLDVFTGTYLDELYDSISGLHTDGTVLEVSPYTHEIGAIAYYPESGSAVVYEVYRNHTWVARDLADGHILRDDDPPNATTPGLVSFTLTWWESENSVWRASNWRWIVTTDPRNSEAFVADFFSILDPYHRLWLDAFTLEATSP